MSMKSYIGAFVLLAGVLISLASCEKNDELNKLDTDYRVETDYDTDTDFKVFKTYYLPDSILLVGNGDKAQYLDSLLAKPILEACHRNMQKRGYVRTDCKDNADLGLQMTYIASTYHFASYSASPYWWCGFADYWSPFYWGNWGYWYNPYPVHFSVSTGALLVDMLNLKAEQGDDKRLPVVWQSYLTGLLYKSKALNATLAVRGIEQAFKQSSYIITNQ